MPARRGVGSASGAGCGPMHQNEIDVRREWLQNHCPELAVSTEPAVLQSHGRDWTRFREPRPAAVVFPEHVEQVVHLVRVAAEHGVPLVPSGGRTGLSGGAVAAAGEVVVSLDRLRRILDFDATDRTVTVEAGVVTAAVQAYAAERGLCYPVSFGAEGSSQIGGNIATNAGGLRVLRYGLTRDWVAGLSFVDGRGALLECNAGLVKNASGFDLRHLLIGSEGTLGIVVRAMLRLTDPPPPRAAMVLGLDRLDALMPVFRAAREALALSAFEFFSATALQRVCAHLGCAPPLAEACPFLVLLEFDNPDGEDGLSFAAAIYDRCVETGWVREGVIGESATQARALWRYREAIPESIAAATPYKNDLAVRISRVPDFLAALDGQVAAQYPELEVLWYGHIGDGNLHMNVLKPDGMALEAFEQACAAASRSIYALTRSFGGTISAEHGIGLLKQADLGYCRSAAEIEHMRGIKAVLDPAGIMNPGKLIAVG